jgi:hypothetical protein
MKPENSRKPAQDKQKQKDDFRGKTNPPGQNPRQNDDPSHDEHHDEKRQG